MQLDAVESYLLGARGGVGEKRRQHFGQAADVRVLRVGDALAIAELECLALGWGKDARKLVAAHGAQAGADLGVR